MTNLEKYERWLNEKNRQKALPKASCWFNQELRYIDPFHMFANVYYVGDNWICAHLIDVGDGYVLIDTCNYGETAGLVQSIWKMGVDPAQVKWIILTHGHCDHIGGAYFFQKIYGTKVYISAADAEMMREHPERTFIQDGPSFGEELLTPDGELPGDCSVTFGNTEFTIKASPGHTDGTISIFFDVHDNGQTYRAGLFGGMGFNTLSKSFLTELGDTQFKRREILMNSFKRAEKEHVDFFLGNHVRNNQLLQKRKMILENPESNPFIDTTSSEWKNYMRELQKDLERFMNDPNNN